MVLTITRDKVKCESLVLAKECIKLIPRVYQDNCKNRSFTPIYAHLCPFMPETNLFLSIGRGVIGVGPPQMHSTAGNKIDKYCSTGGAGRRIAENGKILWCTALVELF